MGKPSHIHLIAALKPGWFATLTSSN